MHSLYFIRHVLNSSDIKYAGKLVLKLTCFGSLRPVSLLSWDSWWRYLLAGIPDGYCFSRPEGPPRVENIGLS